MSLSIHVVTGQDRELRQNYLIAKLAHHWQKSGHKVSYGSAHRIDADLGIIHIDQTRIARSMIPDNPCNCPLLNRSVLDISKSSFSTLRLLPDDSWTGPVIIKSDLNCFGKREWKKRKKVFFEKKQRRLAEKSWRLARILPPERYPILNALKEVPGWVWKHPEIIVERFMPEREQGFYCIRGWVFFGKRGYTYRLFSTDSVVKTGTMVKYEFLNEPPEELIEFRIKSGFDFGKFDYVEVDGNTILLDINKTPGIVSDADTPRLKYLAEGLNDFL